MKDKENNTSGISRDNLKKNVKVIAILLSLLVAAVVCRLLEIQVINSDRYKRSATNEQWEEEIIPAMRGTIYDANGSVIAQSAQTWKLYLIPENFNNNDKFREQVCRDVADTLGLDFDELMALTQTEEIDENSDKQVIAHKVDVKKQMEKAEKLLIDCDNPENEYIKDSQGKKQLKNPTDCLMHRVYTYSTKNEKGEDKTVTLKYSKVMGLETDSRRYYPMGEFASSVVGTVDSDGNGVAGIERFYNSELAGTDGRKTSYGSDIKSDNDKIYDSSDGVCLKLTIDETIQYCLDKNLKEVYESSGGIGAYGIVMDVHTGAILGMDSVGYKGGYDLSNPTALNSYYESLLKRKTNNEDYTDLEEYLGTSEEAKQELEDLKNMDNFEERIALHAKKLSKYFMLEQWNNYCVSETYHPGSVFKIFLTAAAVEENVMTDKDTFYCGGSYTVDDRVFNCHSSWHGTQDLRKGLMNSCNPFFVQLGLKLGAERFYKYFEAFGFTEKTGIESLEESNSIYYTEDQLSRVRLASESFGQSFSITPIQLITGISAIANGGYLLTPYLVDEKLDADGNVISKTQPTVRRQVISKETADVVASMMESVVNDGGTGRNGRVAGYRVAGKTGTTQKYQIRGTYIASFGCFAPADDPEVAVLIIVDEPQTEMNGSMVCAPVAAKVVETILEYLGVERQYTEEELEELDTTTPGVIGKDVENAEETLRSNGFNVRVVGDGSKVVSQSPAGGQTIPQGGVIVIYTTDDEDAKINVTVPDLTGSGVNGVRRQAVNEGINVRISGATGDGVVCYDQSIEPGTEVEYGTIVKVYFKSSEEIEDG